MKTLTIILLFTTTINLYGQTDKLIIKLNDSINLSLVKNDFKLTDQNIDYYKSTFPVGINGKIIFGTDLSWPKSKLTEATLKIGEKIYNLEISGMYNPWFGNGINENLIKLKKENNGFKLSIIFSDGAGTYGAEWIIYKNSNIRTILSKDENIIIGYFQN